MFLLGTPKNIVNTVIFVTRSRKHRKYRGFGLPRYRKNAAPQIGDPDQAPALALTVRTPQCGHPVWGKNISFRSLPPRWPLKLRISEVARISNYEPSFYPYSSCFFHISCSNCHPCRLYSSSRAKLMREANIYKRRL